MTAGVPDRAYAAGGIEMVRDVDRPSGGRVVQQVDNHTGLPLRVAEVTDADAEARQRTNGSSVVFWCAGCGRGVQTADRNRACRPLGRLGRAG